MRILAILSLLLIGIAPAAAQTAPQVQAQIGVDKSGSEQTIRIMRPGTTKQVAIGKVTADDKFSPTLPAAVLDNTLLDAQVVPYSLDLYNNNGAQKTGRIVKTLSLGEHKTTKRTGTTFEHTYYGHGIPGNSPVSALAADTTMACTIFQQDWLTSTHPGEGDCLELFGRVGYGDSIMLHGNAGTVSGFGALTESVTNAFKGGPYVAGAARCTNGGDILKAIGLQDGVVNTRENESYGHIVLARGNACPGYERFDAGYQVQNDLGSTSYFDRAFRNLWNNGENFAVVGRTGTVLSMGSGSFGYHAGGEAVVQLGQERTAAGSSRIDFSTTIANIPNARIFRDTGDNGAFTFQQTGTAPLQLTSTSSNIDLNANGALRLSADTSGVSTYGTLNGFGALAGHNDVYAGLGQSQTATFLAGSARTADGTSSLQLYSTAATNTIPSALISRAGGTNGALTFQQTGTGPMQLVSTNSGPVTLSSAGVLRLTANSAGVQTTGTFDSASTIVGHADVYVGYGTGTSAATLLLGGSRTADGPAVMNMYAAGGAGVSAYLTRNAGANGLLNLANTGTAAITLSPGGVERFRVGTAATKATGPMEVTGNLAVGITAPGDVLMQLGLARTGAGASFMDFITGTADVTDARVYRGPGTDANLSIQNNGAGALAIAAPSGTVNVSAGGVTRLTANGTGLGFNGATPVAKQTIAAAFANPAAATNEQLATAYNSLRTALVNLGLAQ